MGAVVDLTGQRFGRLLVISRSANIRNEAGWLCRCDCGKEKEVRGYHLRRGLTQSCGCLQKERTGAASREANTTHGMSRTPTHISWRSMMNRCANPKTPGFSNYGGRGIKVCERWLKFENFLTDMGVRPLGTTLDRKDNNGGYDPDNCRWTTPKEQQNNNSYCRIVTANGISQNVQQWSEQTGLGHSTILSRLRRGWSPEAALSPVRCGRGGKPLNS